MSQLNKLYRNFIILQEDERGYSISNDKTLSGYSKIEAKGEKCKISFYAQNLRIDSDDYYMLAVCSKKDSKQLINLGKIAISDNGKAEVVKEYFLDDIGGSGISFDKVTGAAIAKIRNDTPLIVMCGFTNGEQPTDNWKDYKLVEYGNNKLKDKKDNKRGLSDDDDAISERDHKKYKEKTKSCKDDENKSKENKEKKNNEDFNDKIKHCNEQEEKKKHYDDKDKDEDKDKIKHCDGEEEKKKYEHHHDVNNCDVCNCREEDSKEDISDNPFVKDGDDSNPFGNYERSSTGPSVSNKFDDYESKIDELSDKFEIRGSVGEYFEGIASGFENIPNQYREIKNCKWYKVPVTDLDDMCNVTNYNRYTVAYYPMLNYYPYIRKHGYFNLGYKCDRAGNLKYIVYGIPGNRSLDDQPYEGKTGFVTWINNENRDDIGCWLMFYDFRNSTVVVPME